MQTGWLRAGLVGLVACSGPGSGDPGHVADLEPYPREGPIPARIAHAEGRPLVEVPDRAPAHGMVRVLVRTEGGGCIRKGDTGVTREGETVDIRPLDVYPAPGAICTADYRLLDHEARFGAGAPGSLRVRIRGVRQEAGGGSTRIIPVTITRTIVVE